jgi:hypothetical protein
MTHVPLMNGKTPVFNDYIILEFLNGIHDGWEIHIYIYTYMDGRYIYIYIVDIYILYVILYSIIFYYIILYYI